MPFAMRTPHWARVTVSTWYCCVESACSGSTPGEIPSNDMPTLSALPTPTLPFRVLGVHSRRDSIERHADAVGPAHAHLAVSRHALEHGADGPHLLLTRPADGGEAES